MFDNYVFEHVTIEIRLTVYCDKDFPRVYHFHTDMKQTSYLFLSNVCWMIIVWDYYPRKSCKVVYLLTRSIFGLLICMEIWNKPVTCFDHHVRHVAEMSCRVRIGLSWFEFISCLNDCRLELFPQKFVEVQHCHESFLKLGTEHWTLAISGTEKIILLHSVFKTISCVIQSLHGWHDVETSMVNDFWINNMIFTMM